MLEQLYMSSWILETLEYRFTKIFSFLHVIHQEKNDNDCSLTETHAVVLAAALKRKHNNQFGTIQILRQHCGHRPRPPVLPNLVM